MKLSTRWRTVVLVAAVGLADRAAAMEDIFDIQPGDKFSTIALQGMSLTDDAFAEMLGDTLIDEDGDARVKNAAFFFQQCFGGGIFDDLIPALVSNAPPLNWVGGAAAKHDEPAVGFASRREIMARGGTPPDGYPEAPINPWTRGLITGLRHPTVTMHDAAGSALAYDPFGSYGSEALGIRGTETGQRVTRNDGTFMLRDPDAKSWHALLLAGVVDGDRFRSNIDAMHQMLRQAWGDPATNPDVSISVLFGNGMTDAAGNPLPAEWNAQAATLDNLMTTLDTIKGRLNTDEQFFLYVTDHGDTNANIPALRTFIAPGVRRDGSFSLSAGELRAFQADPNNPDSHIELNYVVPGTPGPGDHVNVFFNDMLLDSVPLQPGLNVVSAPVSETLFGQNNQLSIENNGLIPFTVTTAQFRGAPLSDLSLTAPVPPERFSVFDDFNQVDEFGQPLSLNLSAAGPVGEDHKDVANIPALGLIRGQSVFASAQSDAAMATIKMGLNAAMPGTLQFDLTGAQPGDAAFAVVTYLLDDSGQNLNYPGGAVLEVHLAQPPLGDIQVAALVGDAAMTTDSVLLEPNNLGTVYRGVLTGGTPLDMEHITAVRFNFLALANTDARIVIDAIRIVPEPASVVLLVLGCALIRGNPPAKRRIRHKS